MSRLKMEDGSIMIMAAGWVGLFVLLAVFVVDIGNWFEHKRHLQLQADAGALAAAGEFGVVDPDNCPNAAIEARARQYAGIEGEPLYNQQVGRTPADRIHFMLNSPTYFGQSTPVDTTVVEGPPCEAKMIDVKLTETDLPWYWQIGSVDFINAHARVSIVGQSTGIGLLPVGVPDPNPKRAWVQFVDEATGAVLATRELDKAGSQNGLVMWNNEADPASVVVDSAHVGVRAIFSGSENNTECGQPLVDCYDLESDNGIVHIRGWQAGSAAVEARDVRLVPGTCTDAYFSYSTTSCTIGMEAEIGLTGVDPADLELKAVVGNKKTALTYDAASGTWATPATIALAPGAGPVNLSLEWRRTANCSATCTGTFTNVQRAFSGTDSRSGPVQLAQVSEAGTFGANSFERSTTPHDLVAHFGLQGNLQNARDVNDPVVSLRVVGGSQNQSLDCDSTIPNLRDEIAFGCGPGYEVNQGTPCPDDTEPYNCVPLQTGTQRNQVAAGMNLRVYGDPKATTCTSPNNWADFPNIPPGDPRIIQVFLTPFGSFQGSGNDSIPVTNFATFYATGWSGQGAGFANPCEGQGDDAVPNGEGGYLVGHFIKYIQRVNNGGGGSEPCDFGAFGNCVAVLTE